MFFLYIIDIIDLGDKMEREIIRVIDDDDTELDVELISILEHDNKKYLVYTKGEKQKNGNKILYISKLRVKMGKYILENIYDDNEWSSLKELLKNIISE